MKNMNSHLATETVLHRGRFLIVAIIGLFVSGIGMLPARAQAPGLIWTTAVNGRLFAVDALTNSYASQASGAVVVVNPLGVPAQTNTICPLPGIARRDATGNFYFAGSFDGTNDFGGITLVGGWINSFNYNPPRWAPGWPTCFLVKYASNGSLLWAVSFGTPAMANHLSDLAINADGSAVVGFSTPGNGDKLAKFSSIGTNVWISTIPGSFGTFKALKVSRFIGTNGCFLHYRDIEYTIGGGFYDAAGNLTFFTGFPQLHWKDALSTNGQPVAGTSQDAYVAGLGNLQPILQKSYAGGGIAWTQALGSVEQWVLGGDNQGNLFLAGTNGIFSKHDVGGTLIWTTNYGSPAVALEMDSVGNRFVSFSNGAVARLANDPPPQSPTIFNGPHPQTVFVGDSVSLTAGVTGTPPFRYWWRLNETNVPSATNAACNLGSITTAQAGFYSLVVSNVAGAFTSTPALLRVKSVQLYAGSQMLTNGTYTFASPPTLTIRSAFPSGSSFFTLDGSAPSFSETFYSGPFVLGQSATVRALGYSSDFLQSEEADAVNAIVLVNHTLSVSSSGGGTVNLNPAGGTYLSTNLVTVSAVPLAGYSFLNWLGDAQGTSPTVIISMERDKTIHAVFGTTLSATVAGNGQIQLHPSGGVYAYGSMVRLTALPDAGNYFGFWGSAATGNTNPLYFTISAPTQTVSSIFAATPGGQAALTLLINGRGRVNPLPRANAYTLNQSITLTAVPGAGESFSNWSGDAGGTQNPLPVTMSTAKVITAHFTSEPRLRVDRAGMEGVVPGGFRLTVVSDPGSVHEILASTNFTTWASLGTVSNSFGEVQYTDTNSPGLPQRFYKAAP